MRIAAFLTGMAGSAAVVAVLATGAGYSAWAVAGLVAATIILSQLLYLGLILLMVKEESASRYPSDLSGTPADPLIRRREPRQPHF